MGPKMALREAKQASSSCKMARLMAHDGLQDGPKRAPNKQQASFKISRTWPRIGPKAA